MLGSGYVIEHCVAAVRRKSRQQAYEYYTTDIFRALAMMLGAKSVKRYADIFEHKAEDTRSPDEIVADITEKAGLRVVRDNERDESDGDAGP